MRDFHRRDIWRRAHTLAIEIHDAARGMRGNEFAALRSQLTRAADSIAALSARDRHVLTLGQWQKFSNEAVEIRRMTHAYRKRLLEDSDE